MTDEVTVMLNTWGTETLSRYMDQHLSKRIGKLELTQNKENCIKPLIWQRVLKEEICSIWAKWFEYIKQEWLRQIFWSRTIDRRNMEGSTMIQLEEEENKLRCMTWNVFVLLSVPLNWGRNIDGLFLGYTFPDAWIIPRTSNDRITANDKAKLHGRKRP